MPARVTGAAAGRSGEVRPQLSRRYRFAHNGLVSSALYERARHVQHHTMKIPAQTDAGPPRRPRTQSSAARCARTRGERGMRGRGRGRGQNAGEAKSGTVQLSWKLRARIEPLIILILLHKTRLLSI